MSIYTPRRLKTIKAKLIDESLDGNHEIQMKMNTVFEPLFVNAVSPNPKRYVMMLGGRGSGKSYAISEYIIWLLTGGRGTKVRIAILRFSLKNAKDTLFQEIVDRIAEKGLTSEFYINKQTGVVTFGENELKSFGFKISDRSETAKMKGLASYTDVFIEEAEEITNKADFDTLDLSMREKKIVEVDELGNETVTVKPVFVYFICNPMFKGHWIMDRYFDLVPVSLDIPETFYELALKEANQDSHLFIFSTYKDNLFLPETYIKNLESRKIEDPAMYYNQIMGYVSGGKYGRVYTNWEAIPREKFDEIDQPIVIGLDYGYSNDPTAAVAVKVVEDKKEIYVRQLIYETGLQNRDIFDKLEEEFGDELADIEVYPDKEPKSNAELEDMGLQIMDTEKGAGSRKIGVKLIQGYTVYYTEDSKDLEKEMAGYCWATRRDGTAKNEPQDGDDHLLDSFRYVIYSKYNTSSFWNNYLNVNTNSYNMLTNTIKM